MTDISLSYAQQYNLSQDLAAVRVLKRLAVEYINPDIAWHIVLYTFMGLFPQTSLGHQQILYDSVQLACLSGARRLIVKTKDESFAIPSVKSNINTLTQANAYAISDFPSIAVDEAEEEIIYQQSKRIIDGILNLSPNLNTAICQAFKIGLIDIPYCLHPDNKRLTKCVVKENGYIDWLTPGHMPIDTKSFTSNSCPISQQLSSENFLQMLSFNRQKYDHF